MCKEQAMKTTLLLCALLLNGCFSTAPVGVSPRQAAAKIYYEISRVSVYIESSHGSGSGVIVEQDSKRALVLTAAHVVEGVDKVLVMRNNPKGYPTVATGFVILVDRDLDFAMLRTLPVWTDVAYVPTFSQLQNITLYQQALMYGHPMGCIDGHLTAGYICDFDDDGLTRVSTPGFYGNSGGGIFAEIDNHWYLIGICQKVYTYYDMPITHMIMMSMPGRTVAFYQKMLLEEHRR